MGNNLKAPAIAAKAEVMMMGATVPVESADEAAGILHYLKDHFNSMGMEREGKFSPEIVIDSAESKYAGSRRRTITHIGVAKILKEFWTAHFALDCHDDEDEDILSENGKLCWVENLSAPDLSELGMCGFKLDGGVTRRAW
jgi:hypothetical protein